ncbi:MULTISPECIES: hypothetical protein [Enterococcus]|uniref:Uncharacterized protein n=1 Tax=Enterococcus alishanensis TaxID=1303817 RepID=A0ABS6TFR4_9ENTE|nr:hypothetical protein [Enterococcus alishanensis]
MAEMLFVYIDTTSNAVFSKGLSPQDFVEGIVHQPEHLLLLNPAASAGEFDSHTGLKIINGTNAVSNFFSIRQLNSPSAAKWIDFTDPALLKELSPLEISELLYFGHMKTHLHSPFFYKLQNNFVYFNFGNDTMRVYYRYLDEFYRILANKLSKIVLEKNNFRRTLFARGPQVAKLDGEILKQLYPFFQEGAIFNIPQEPVENQQFHIPIYLSDEKGWRRSQINLRKEQKVAELTYDLNKKIWHLEVEDDDLAFSFH